MSTTQTNSFDENNYDDINDEYDMNNIQISNRHIDNLNLRLVDLPIYNRLKNSKNQCLQEIVSVKRNPILYSKPGYILRVEIKGFLTHINKTIDITNVIQLIFGPNGSGKSSILESIVFCLCGEKNHIRQNLEVLSNLKTQAGLISASGNENDVAVIKQTSITVYFAKPIALRRTITEKDTCTYHICNFSNDKTKFRKITKQDAIDILHTLNHYPNNRVTMVNQQEMKQLARMQPNERYILFSDASGLSDVMIKMKCALEDIEKIKDTIVQCQQLRNKLKEQYKEVNQKWKDAEILRKQQEILLKLQIKQDACQFGQKYIVMHNIIINKQNSISDYSNISNQYQSLQQKYDEAMKNSEQLKKDLQLKKEQRLDVCNVQNQLQNDYNNIQANLQVLKSKAEIYQEKIDECNRQIQNCTEDYEKYNQKINSYQQQPALIKPEEPQELRVLKDECQQLKINKQNIDDQIILLSQEEQQLKQQYKQMQEKVEQATNNIEIQKQNLLVTQQNLLSEQQNLGLKKRMIMTLQASNKQFQNHDFTQLKYGIVPYLHVYVKRQYQGYAKLICSMIQPDLLQQLVYLKENEYQFNKERNQIDQHHIISDVKYYKLVQQRNLREEISKHKELQNIKIILVQDCLEFTDRLALQHLIVKSNIDSICITDTRDHASLIAETLQKVYVYCEEFGTHLYNNNGQIDSNKNKFYQRGLSIYVDNDTNQKQLQQRIYHIQSQIQQQQQDQQRYQQELDNLNYEQKLLDMNKAKQNYITAQNQQQIQFAKKQQERENQQDEYNKQLNQYQKEVNKRELQQNEYEHAKARSQSALQELNKYQNDLVYAQEKLKRQNKEIQDSQQQCNDMTVKINKQKQINQQLQKEIQQLQQLLQQIQQDTMQQALQNLQQQLGSIQEKVNQYQEKIDQQKIQLLQYSQQLLEKIKKIQSQTFQQYINQIDNIQQDEKYLDNYAKIIAQFVSTNQQDQPQNQEPTQQLFDSYYLKYQQGIQQTEQSCAELQSQFTYNINDIYAQRISLINKLTDNNKNIEFAKNTLKSTTQILGKLIVKIAALRETCRQKICQEFDKEVSLLNLQMALQFNLKPIPKLEDFHLDSNVLEGQDKELYQQLTQSNIQNNVHQDEINILLKDRDVSTLSGGEQTFTALAFIMSCIQITKSIFFSCDEWDVYLDAERRTKAFEKLVKMISMSDVQTILVTPNDVDLDQVQLTPEEKSLISVEKLQGVKRL